MNCIIIVRRTTSAVEGKMKNTQGYVYILTSPNTNFIKIGGTDYPPIKRIK
jgi:hypothetical protein